MKMTLDLDDDVEHAIRDILKQEPDKSFERIVNDLLRIGLTEEGLSYDSESFTSR